MKKRNLKIISAIAVLTLTAALSTDPLVTFAKSEEKPIASSEETYDGSAFEIKVTENKKDKNTTVNPQLTVKNTNKEDINLKDVVLEYYYTSGWGVKPSEDGMGEHAATETFNCYYAGTDDGDYANLTSYVNGEIERFDIPSPDADTTLRISFTGGVLKAGQSMTVNTSINKADWSNYDKTNDYSYDNSEKVVGYLGDKIVFGNAPLEVGTPVEKIEGSHLKNTYFTLDKDNIEDIRIPMDCTKDQVGWLNDLMDSDDVLLSDEHEYKIYGSTLILKKEYLESIADGKNRLINVSFKDGKSQNILLHNEKNEEVKDPLRSGISQDEPEISFSYTSDKKSCYPYPNIMTMTNTSAVDMDLSQLKIYKFYNKDGAKKTIEFDNYPIAYASILGQSKDLSPDMIAYQRPDGDDLFLKNNFVETYFKEGAGVLKPGQTLVLGEHFTPKSEYSKLGGENEPVVTYNGESIYGSFPETMQEDAKILTPDVEISNKEDPKDVDVKLKLNSNALSSISLFDHNKPIGTLMNGIDYKVNKRDEVIISKNFLDSLNAGIINLDFKFSNGHHDSMKIYKLVYIHDLNQGSLTISDKEAAAFCKMGLDHNEWTDLVVPVYLNNLKDQEIDGGNITLNFDKDFFADAKIEDLDESTASATVNAALGTVNIELKGSQVYLDEDKPLFNLRLTPGKYSCPTVPPYTKEQKLSLSEDSYYLTAAGAKLKPKADFKNFKLMDLVGSPKALTETASVKQGDTLTIPVLIKDAKYYNISSFNLGFNYDKNIFASAEIKKGDVLAPEDGIFTSENNDLGAKVNCVYNPDKTDAYKVTKDGVLVNLVLKVKDDAPLGETKLTNLKNNDLTFFGHDSTSTYNFGCDIYFGSVNITAR